jgi:peptide-N4-(N-acetyl-beta-glucosaminyl)asparagine amidase
MSPRIAGVEEQDGRQSGSMAWRLARGEIQQSSRQFIITPLEQEITDKLLHIRYNCAIDKYLRHKQTVNGWDSMVYEITDVQRKVESDWKMAYLARTEGAGQASITWKFDLKSMYITI